RASDPLEASVRVCFIAPSYPAEMPDFTRGLADVGARVVGVGSEPASRLHPKAAAALHDYIRVPNLLDEDAVVRQVTQALRARGGVDRVESCWEPTVLAAARIRGELGVQGMSISAVRGFRDKQLMKERIKAAGLRVPHSARVRTAEEARAAAERIGFPLILKPIDGAGSADTHRVDSARDLEHALGKMGHVREASCEEFIDGEEFTYDTVCIAVRPVYENVAQYLPRPLIARTEEWISPLILTERDLEAPRLAAGVQLGRGVLEALGMGSGFTHMEWYRTAAGEVVFGEIGCRPGGARLVDQMNLTGDIDLFRAWARAVCGGEAAPSRVRKYHCGIIFKRARGQGRIAAVHGLARFLQRHGRHVVDETLLRPGQHRRDWTKTLVSDGYILYRHPDRESALAIAREFQETVHLVAR
ncbi:MAG: ATP-grasp domain-containing protein, partial [Myxococcota bacterium]|nr:ATP-grasp domain-containing protein [Myxococcota bacterium]